MTAPTPTAPGVPDGTTTTAPTPTAPDGGGTGPAPAPTPPVPPSPPVVEPGAPRTAADGTRTAGRQHEQDEDAVTAAARAATAGQPAEPARPVAPAPAGDAWKVEDLPTGAQKLIGELRAEAAQRRTEAKDAGKTATDTQAKLDSFLDGFARVMGLTEEAKSEPLDPERLTAELSATRGQHKEALRKLAVYEAAAVHGGNARALTDSVSFLATVNRIDTAADDFAAQVSAAVAAAISTNPSFKAAGPAPAAPIPPSGGEFTGGPGRPRDLEALSVDDFRKQLTESRRS